MTGPAEKGILWFVLDEASQQALKAHCAPLFEQLFYHHVTLVHDIEPSDERVVAWVGRTTEVAAYAVAHNDQAQAVRIQPSGMPDKYGVPHITLSTSKGIPPVASVAMLQGSHDEKTLDPPLVLTGTVEFEYLHNITD